MHTQLLKSVWMDAPPDTANDFAAGCRGGGLWCECQPKGKWMGQCFTVWASQQGTSHAVHCPIRWAHGSLCTKCASMYRTGSHRHIWTSR